MILEAPLRPLPASQERLGRTKSAPRPPRRRVPNQSLDVMSLAAMVCQPHDLCMEIERPVNLDTRLAKLLDLRRADVPARELSSLRAHTSTSPFFQGSNLEAPSPTKRQATRRDPLDLRASAFQREPWSRNSACRFGLTSLPASIGAMVLRSYSAFRVRLPRPLPWVGGASEPKAVTLFISSSAVS